MSSSIASSGSTVCWLEIFQTHITFAITLDVILRMISSQLFQMILGNQLVYTIYDLDI